MSKIHEIRENLSTRKYKGNKYMDHQMKHDVKNQICPKKPQCITLHSWLFDMIVRNNSLTVTKTRIATILQKEKLTNMQNNQHLQGFSDIEDLNFEFWLEWCILSMKTKLR